MQHLARALITTLFALIAPLAMAEPRIASVPEIRTQIAAGQTILLDIRSEAEWRETGLAEGAWPVSLHSASFPADLRAILEAHGPRNVALICATGGRTDFVVRTLEKNGITGVTDVSEGMMGNPKGPGWIARGAPIVSLSEAKSAYTAAMGKN